MYMYMYTAHHSLPYDLQDVLNSLFDHALAVPTTWSFFPAYYTHTSFWYFSATPWYSGINSEHEHTISIRQDLVLATVQKETWVYCKRVVSAHGANAFIYSFADDDVHT